MSQSPSFTRKKFSRFWERHFHPGAPSQSCKCLFGASPHLCCSPGLHNPEKANSGLLSHIEQLLQQDWQGIPFCSLHTTPFLILLCTKIPLKSTGSNTPGSTPAVLNKQALVTLPKTCKNVQREECWYSCDRGSRTLARWLCHSWSLAHL